MNRRLLITGAGDFSVPGFVNIIVTGTDMRQWGVTHRELDIEDFVAVSAFIKGYPARLCPALCGNFKHRYM